MKIKIAKIVLAVLAIAMMMSLLCVVSSAAVFDKFIAQGASVTLDGTNSETVTVAIVGNQVEQIYGVEGNWDITEQEGTNKLTLTAISSDVITFTGLNYVDAASGKVLWQDSSFVGVSSASDVKLLIATYTVAADTPAGEYTVRFRSDVMTGSDYNPDITVTYFTTTITVTRKAAHTCSANSLTKVVGQAATCTVDGWKDYYQCSDTTCSKLYADEAGETEITLDAWKTGGGKIAAAHTYGELIAAQAEVHTTTELKAGVAAHYFCDVCDTYFTADKVATTLDALTGEAPEHAHSTYGKDASQHWSICSCGYVFAEKSNHTYVSGKCVCTAKQTFTVTLVENDGSIDHDVLSQTVNYGETATWSIIPSSMTRYGYTFSKFTTNPDGTGTSYYVDQYTGLRVANVTSDLTLYAQWTPNEYNYTIEIYYMDTTGAYGEPETSTQTGVYGTTVSITPDEKEGFMVDTDASKLSGTVSVSGTTLKIYYIRNQYTFTWIVNGESNRKDYYYGATIEQPEYPIVAGKEFDGWNPEIPDTMPAEDLTVEARFTPIEYSIEVYDNEGELIDNYEWIVYYGNTIELDDMPEVTVPDGYTLVWYIVGTNSDAKAEFPVTVTGDVTLRYELECKHTTTKPVSNGDGTHTQVCQNTACGEKIGEAEKCSGGEATCIAKANCFECSQPYGNLDGGNHAYGTPTTGWYQIGTDWYYGEKSVCGNNGEHIKHTHVTGLARVAYPEASTGLIYAPNADDLEYYNAHKTTSKYSDAETAEFYFGEDGKFQATFTGIVGDSYVVNGIAPWHVGFVQVGEDYYYFAGDKTNGGNVMATGKVYATRNYNSDKANGIYNFDTDGTLIGNYYGLFEQDGEIYYRKTSTGELATGKYYITQTNGMAGFTKGDKLYFDNDGKLLKTGIYENADGSLSYYVNGQLQIGTGVVELTDEAGETYYIYVRSNGELATGKYWPTTRNGYLDSGEYDWDTDGKYYPAK